MHNKSSRPSVDCSKEYSKISSRDLGCYDPKISTFATFKTLDFDNKNKDKNRRTRSRPNWNFSATTLVLPLLSRPAMTARLMSSRSSKGSRLPIKTSSGLGTF